MKLTQSMLIVQRWLDQGATLESLWRQGNPILEHALAEVFFMRAIDQQVAEVERELGIEGGGDER